MTISEAVQDLIENGLIRQWWYGRDCVCIEWVDGEVHGYADENTAILVALGAAKVISLQFAS